MQNKRKREDSEDTQGHAKRRKLNVEPPNIPYNPQNYDEGIHWPKEGKEADEILKKRINKKTKEQHYYHVVMTAYRNGRSIPNIGTNKRYPSDPQMQLAIRKHVIWQYAHTSHVRELTLCDRNILFSIYNFWRDRKERPSPLMLLDHTLETIPDVLLSKIVDLIEMQGTFIKRAANSTKIYKANRAKAQEYEANQDHPLHSMFMKAKTFLIEHYNEKVATIMLSQAPVQLSSSNSAFHTVTSAPQTMQTETKQELPSSSSTTAAQVQQQQPVPRQPVATQVQGQSPATLDGVELTPFAEAADPNSIDRPVSPISMFRRTTPIDPIKQDTFGPAPLQITKPDQTWINKFPFR